MGIKYPVKTGYSISQEFGLLDADGESIWVGQHGDEIVNTLNEYQTAVDHIQTFIAAVKMCQSNSSDGGQWLVEQVVRAQIFIDEQLGELNGTEGTGEAGGGDRENGDQQVRVEETARLDTKQTGEEDMPTPGGAVAIPHRGDAEATGPGCTGVENGYMKSVRQNMENHKHECDRNPRPYDLEEDNHDDPRE